MIEKVRKEDIFKVNYINLIDFTTHDGSRVVKWSTLPLPAICEPTRNSTVVKRKKLWVEYNHKKA